MRKHPPAFGTNTTNIAGEVVAARLANPFPRSVKARPDVRPDQHARPRHHHANYRYRGHFRCEVMQHPTGHHDRTEPQAGREQECSENLRAMGTRREHACHEAAEQERRGCHDEECQAKHRLWTVAWGADAVQNAKSAYGVESAGNDTA